MITLDRQWRYTYVNKAAAAFLRTTPAEVMGKVIWETFPHLQDSRFHEEFLRAAQEKTFVKVEDYYEPLGRWYECRCHPTENGLAVFLTDTTGNKRIEETILENRQVLEMAVAGSDAGIWRLDLDPERPGYVPDYVYLSPQLKALIGFENNEFPNSRSAWQDRILPEDRVLQEHAARAHIEGRTEMYQVDFRIRHRDGSIRWLASRGRLYRDEFNRPLRWAGVDTDVTDRVFAAESMRENEERLRQALEAGEVFTFEWRPATDEVLRSPNCASILGWTGDATRDTGQGFFEGIHPEDRQAFVQLVSTLSPGRPAYDTTYRYTRCDDGREVVLEESGRAVFDESGTMVCLRGLARDVTEPTRAQETLRKTNELLHHQAEELEAANEELQAQQEELRMQASELQTQAEQLRRASAQAQESRRTLEALMEHVPEGITIADGPDVAIRMVSRFGQDLLGGPHDRMTAKDVRDQWRVYREDGTTPLAAEDLPLVRAIREGAAIRNQQLVQVSAAGRRLCLSCNAGPIRDASGAVVGGVVTWRDVSDLKKAEEALRHSEERFRRVFESAAIGIVIADANRDYQAVNDRFCEITGYSREELLTMGCGQIVHPDDQEVDLAEIGRLLRGETASFIRELRYVHASGSTVWVHLNVSVLRGSGQEDPGIIAVVSDITERKQAEEARRESESRMRAMLDHMPIGVWFTDREGCIVYGNQAGQRIWAGAKYVGPDQFAEYKGWWWPSGKLIEPQEWAVVRAVRNGQTSLNEMIEIECFDGTRKIIHNSAVPVRGDSGEILGAVILNEDITSRLRAEEALRESEERFRRAVENAGGAIVIAGLDGVIHYANRGFLALLGYSEQDREAGRLRWDTITPPGRAHLDEQAVAELCSSGVAAPRETEYITRDGRRVPVLVSGSAMGDGPDGRPQIVVFITDLTQQKQLEEQLRRLNDQLEEEVQTQTEELKDTVDRLQDEVARRVLAEGKLRKNAQMLEAFFQHTIAPLAFMDRRFNFVQVNEAYARANDKTPEFFKGKNHFELYPHDENKAIFEEVVRTGEPYRAHARPFSHPDDPSRATYWDWLLMPLRNQGGEIQYLVLNLQDVTRQQKAVDELEHRAFQLQKLTMELSQAEDRERRRMAEVLHDGLQQQLAAAKFHLGLLGSRAGKDPVVCEITTQLDEMLRDAIQQSRSLSHELSPAVLYQSDLCETFEWLARQVQAKHGLTVHTEFHGPVDAQSESIRPFLFRAGQEILFNAVKHARVAEARLRLQRRREQLWLTISDHGQGFDPKALARAAGFGLLSIRERVMLLGGRMKIRSIPGKGSVFLIAVPDVQIAEETEQAGGRRLGAVGARQVSRQEPSASGGRLRVLLVDDHKVMREGLATLIGEQRDMEIVGQAGNGREAIEQARELQPDVIIMDVAMPVMPGDEATRQIKAELPQTRVVALSMFEEPGVREKMLAAGADTYLPKTGPSEGLLAAIRGSDQ